MTRIFTAFACAALVATASCGDAGPLSTETSGTASGTGGSAGGGGSTGVGGSGGEGGGAAVFEPIEGPSDIWAWRPIEGTRCGNGSAAGVAVNLHEGSTDLVIFVSGGGACWDDDMCNGAMPKSIHLHEDLTEAIVLPEAPAVDRSPQAPLATASVAYVPYCTGDLHWGDKTGDYASGPIEHRGASNMRTFLNRLRVTRPDTKRILFYGGSAGGYGVSLHWGTAKEVFGDAVEVHTLADASPLVMPLGDRWDTMKTQWNIQWPAKCAGCEDDPAFLIDALATAHPTSRYGLMAFNNDAVISAYFGYMGDLPAATDALRTTHFDVFEGTKYFVTAGTGHIVLGASVTAPDGTNPVTFAFGCLLGDPAWHSVNF
jgi:hypothetical protein